MKAAVIRKYGKPEVFNIEDISEPQVKTKDVKVRLNYSSVNPVDWKIRRGYLFFVTGWKFPKILGGDFAGTVVECGNDVRDFKVGDEVFGLSNAASKASAYAEFLTINDNKLALKPQSFTAEQAACVPLAGSTAYQALHDLANIQSGMSVLISGCTGGVGHFAVQIAKAAGCQVTGICHSRNAQLAIEIGCDEVIAYDQTDFTKRHKKYNIIFDAASKYGYFKSLYKLEKSGTFVTTLPSPMLMLIHGLSSMLPIKKGKFIGVVSRKGTLEKLAQLCNEGKLKPFIENTFPLEQIAEAHALSETEKVRGKISIKI